MQKAITLALVPLAVAALCLVPLSQAQASPQLAATSVAAAPTWVINCPGIGNVPMTADSEQSLPLQLVATLKCGDEVTVLANDEGYTVRIQAADGTIGYVAAMYLKKVPAPKRPVAAAESVNLKNGVIRWREGAPGCDHFLSNGILVESLTANGITAQVSLHDTGWKLRANVAIANQGAVTIIIEPSKFILDELGKNGRPLFYQDPAELAKNITHQVLWTESVAEPSGAPRTLASAEPVGATTVGYKSSLTPSVSAPNYIIQHQNAEENAVRKEGKQTLVNTSQQIRALALKPANLEPNDKVAGAVWFERGKNPQQLMLRIPIGDQTLEFPLSFKQQK